ncbi:hypothetical protein LTR51_006484 [Lithohypha guttulata]|uniref:DUF7820 domain-containing protein n=2 Tax=Lithohypha guttulata TaxID=1690604 RepID=A0AAN7Y828_9EURO|nr:hypothetical protein LTR51_006484 [Lithohypha guttulata]KAK5088693.1 hypothetical protein LTR05_002914 [Lithohypha guttulata]
MYPQTTRAFSIASRSTFAPGSETPFVSHGGPAHPYELYPQNTTPEGEDEDITSNGIPLGFPRTNFQSSSGGSRSDVGDIVSSDGHIEQLPPYTRYADNTVAKGNMERFNSRRSLATAGASTHTSEVASQPAPPSAADSTTLLRPREQFIEETEDQRARKEGWRGSWKDKAQRHTIAGLPLWGLLAIIAIVISSATIGGIVGGVIGNRQGAQRAYANGAVKTIWLDAIPTTLGPEASPLPTGQFQIPFNQSHEVKECIPNVDTMGAAWGCMDIAYIGVNVFKNESSNRMMASFADFSVNTQDFRYGPQPPDFNGTSFPLQPMQDKDAGAWGVAMFFSVLFDKLAILPESALVPPAEKRSVDARVVARSIASYDGTPLKPSDKPWFCFWNSTINEFFVYINQAAPNEPESTTTQHKLEKWTTSQTSLTTKATLLASTTSGVAMLEKTMATSPTQAPTTFAAYGPTYAGAAASPTTWNKRSYETSAANISNYPKLIKMVEKRRPSDPAVEDYVKPYCQMMQVLDDWSIEPIETVPTICIEEVLYTTSSATATSNARRLLRGRDYDDERDVVGDLESYCICEWTSY